MNLHPRRIHGNTHGRTTRRKALAHVILDRAAAGHDIRPSRVNWALIITGDLDRPARAHLPSENLRGVA